MSRQQRDGTDLYESDSQLDLEVAENGVVTDGLAARSARARAVARGVRSRPPKASVASMVHTQSKERVRGINLQPRKVGKAVNDRARKRQGGTDSMKHYLKDIGSVTLLNANQEVELAKRIQDLMLLEGIRANIEEESGPGAEISDEQWASSAGISEHALHQRLRDGKAAKNEMIQANLRLVVSIAKKYANSNMSFQDLIQEGCVGLIRGAEKFDFQRGYKFSTYAHWWIRQAVTRSISDQSRTIRLPVHLFEIISRITKMEQKFLVVNGRNATAEEIAEELGMSAEKIVQIKKAAQAPVSLQQAMGSDDARTVEDTLVDIHGEGPDKVSGKSLLREDLENVLNTLNPRERDVLRLRYGLDDGRIKTLEEIGSVFSVTRERIRQIEAKALRKLKQPSRNSILQDYYNDPDVSTTNKAGGRPSLSGSPSYQAEN
jgi:RNA polymerase primary sigma factor